MSKHTPGPWRVDKTKTMGAYGVWTDYATHPGHDNAGYPSQVCSVITEAFSLIGDNREVRDANALLIAVAPELLVACKRAMHFIEENNEEIVKMPNSLSLYCHLKEVLAKIEE